jgi:hypothetical protein
MEFAVAGYLSKDGNKILLFSNDARGVYAASVPQLGGTASTQLLPGRVKVAEMNTHLSPILEQTSYSAAYLYVMMHEAVYEWTRKSGWKTHPTTARRFGG